MVYILDIQDPLVLIELAIIDIVVDFKHLDRYLLIEELDKLVEEFDTMVMQESSMELVVLKNIIELVAIIKYLKERFVGHMIKLAVELDIEERQHIIKEHIKVFAIGVQECKIVAINAELELYRVIQAIEVTELLEDIKKEKLVFNNKVRFMEFMQSRLLEEYIMAIKQNIEEIILAVRVEYIAVKEANIRLVVAGKSMANIVVFVMASKIS